MSTYDKKEKLEEKTEKDYSNYRLERVLEILLSADLKRLNELWRVFTLSESRRR